MYSLLPPVWPGTSLSCTPPNSLYWIQRSLSISSAAARNRRMAASPLVRVPVLWAHALEPLPSSSAPIPTAPADRLCLKNDLRLVVFCNLFFIFCNLLFIQFLLHCSWVK